LLAVDSDLIGFIIGGVIGIAGLLAGWLNLRESNRHQLAMAREEREQERLGDAYVRLLGMVERAARWAHMVKPIIGIDPPDIRTNQ
jgi:hypothetical protein